MNSEPTTTQERADADEALGSAIGAAINARVDTPVAPPPVSLIAKRAEVQARARAVQRTVVGIAASITLLAGGVVAYNAFGSDNGTSTFATEPTVTANTTDPPTTVVTDETSTDESSHDESSTGASVTNESSTGESVDPTLTWTEYTPSWTGADQLDVYSVESVGDGRVLARAFTGTGFRILISENGTDWTQAAVPDGLFPDFIDISGDRWLIAGEDITRFPPAGNRAFYSDSEGEDWTELVLDEAPGDHSSIVLALASGQNMVIVFEISDDEQNPEEPPPDGQLMVYTSDGDTTTPTGQFVSGYTTGSSNAEGFHIVINTSEEELLLTSADGFEWTETPTFDTVFQAPESTGLRWLSRTDTWYIEAYSDETRVKSLDQIGDPESVTATIRPVSHLFSLDVGPAGMVAIAVSDSSPRELLLGLSRDGRNWEWMDPSVAFGVAGGQAALGFAADEGYLHAPTVDFAVGTDFVLASVTEFDTPIDTEPPQIRSTSWFKEPLE